MEYITTEINKYVAEWAKPPLLERISYLEYALNGDYDLAIKHAELAIEEEIKIDISSRQKNRDQTMLNA